MSRPPVSVDVFEAIADPTRRALLEQLQRGAQPVKQLAEPFQITLPALSQHLRVLRKVGLVSQRKVGRQHFYQINPQPLKDVADWVNHYEQFWQEKLDTLDNCLEEQSRPKP